jgi:hypothetical protein
LGEEFDDAVEANATASSFASLQQLEDAKYWEDAYKKSLDETLASLDDYPDEVVFAGGGTSLIGEMRSLYPDMVSGRTNAYNSAIGVV